MVFKVTFNSISDIAWPPVLIMEETGIYVENHRPDKIYHILLYRVHPNGNRIRKHSIGGMH